MADAIDDELREVLASLRAQIERQRECGAAWLPIVQRGAPAAEPMTSRAAPAAPSPAAPPPRSEDLFAEPAVREAASLVALAAVIGDCQRCKLAGLGRTQIVFGVGNPAAD